MFVFDAEKHPEPSAEDFGEGDEEGQDSGVLDIIGVDGVEYPVESQYRIDGDSDIVEPGLLVC